MLKGATARRYAQAVFELARESGRVDRWRDDVRTIAEYLGNRRLLFVLNEPKIPAERKELMVRDLLAARVQPEALNLALVLVERGIAELAPRISDEFERLYNDFRGEAPGEVTTAVPLDDDLRAQIARQLQAITGKRILLRERVDPAILGGAVARVGDTLIDGSLRRRFALLRQQIAAGTFGGADDGGSLAALSGSDLGPGSGGAPAPAAPTGGTSGGAGQPGTSQAPSSSDGASGQTQTRATETAPRAHDAPHMQPRSQRGVAVESGLRSSGTASNGRAQQARRRRRR